MEPNEWMLEFVFKRKFKEAEIEEWAVLIHKIPNIHLTTENDKWTRKLEKSVYFITKSLNSISDRQLLWTWRQGLQQNLGLSMSKIRSKFYYGKLIILVWTPSRECLKGVLGFIFPQICIAFVEQLLNPSATSCTLHIFETLMEWDSIFVWLAYCYPRNILRLHLLLIDHPFKNTKATFWSFIVTATIWRIWSKRNSRIFRNKASSPLIVLEISLFYAFFGIKIRQSSILTTYILSSSIGEIFYNPHYRGESFHISMKSFIT